MTYTTERTAFGFIVVSKRRKHGNKLYFGGIRQGKPQFYSDHLYSRKFKTEETAQKYAEILNEKARNERGFTQ